MSAAESVATLTSTMVKSHQSKNRHVILCRQHLILMDCSLVNVFGLCMMQGLDTLTWLDWPCSRQYDNCQRKGGQTWRSTKMTNTRTAAANGLRAQHIAAPAVLLNHDEAPGSPMQLISSQFGRSRPAASHRQAMAATTLQVRLQRPDAVYAEQGVHLHVYV